MPCSASSALAPPRLDTRYPRARPPSSSTRPPAAGTGEPGPLMSSTADRLPPLGTAAHLPPGGLIAVAWSGVALAGAFGECVFGSVCAPFWSVLTAAKHVWEPKALDVCSFELSRARGFVIGK